MSTNNRGTAVIINICMVLKQQISPTLENTYPPQTPLGRTPPAYQMITVDTHCKQMRVLWGWQLILSMLTWWCWCGGCPSRQAIPLQTPIGSATTCIWDDDRRHASHTDACPVGTKWGEVECGAKGSGCRGGHVKKGQLIIYLIVWLWFVCPNRVIQQNLTKIQMMSIQVNGSIPINKSGFL